MSNHHPERRIHSFEDFSRVLWEAISLPEVQAAIKKAQQEKQAKKRKTTA